MIKGFCDTWELNVLDYELLRNGHVLDIEGSVSTLDLPDKIE